MRSQSHAQAAVGRGTRARVARCPSPAEHVLNLQRTAGNRAVAQLIGRSAPPARTLQRYVGWEHQLLGDKGSMAMCRGKDPAQCRTSPIVIEVAPGIKLTWGQVTALAGDEFETVEELRYYAASAGPQGESEDEETRGRLRAAMQHDMDDRPSGSTGIPAGLHDGGEAARKANESHYNDLAFDNLDHFPSGGRAREAWKRHHDMAITHAVHAGLGDAAYSMNDAYLYEAFGDHFLTDSFSAGHIRTPRSDIVAWYETNWAPWARQNFKSWLVIQALKHGVSADTLVALLKRWGKTVDDLVRIAIAELTPAVAGAVSGTIHDYEGLHGVDVSAPATFGVQFTTWGDDSLPGARGRAANQTSGVAQKLAIAAIGTARNHLEIAYDIGRSVARRGGKVSDVYDQLRKRGIDWPYDDVWNFVPQAVPGATPTPWAHWRWGQMDPWFVDQVNRYARDTISSHRVGVVNSLPDFTIQINDNPPFQLRQVVDDALKSFAADPLGTIGNLILWPALDPRYVPTPVPTP